VVKCVVPASKKPFSFLFSFSIRQAQRCYLYCFSSWSKGNSVLQ